MGKICLYTKRLLAVPAAVVAHGDLTQSQRQHIALVLVEEDGGFEKTPTHKIRRFKYNGSNNAKTGEASPSAAPETPPAVEKGSESADSSSGTETRGDA